ncbi:MAG TPA: hypothetical protein EYM65_08155 [Dehalococcoidia bacterium]|nr:hypothetical protein [Gemmatimonadota bacterium]HIN06191.1 hypothetical protein [Dehalococcoidia bacterium]
MAEIDASIYAISVDTLDLAKEVVENNNLTFTMAYGATKEHADAVGGWWASDANHGEYNQPIEFILGRGGVVLGSIYASGPVGRMGADEAVRLINFRERARLAQEEKDKQA